MKQNFKPITKQLAIAALILSSITILSFGIRQVRFNTYRADIVEFTPSACPSDTEDHSQPEQHLDAKAASDYYPADSYTIDAEPDQQHANASDWQEQAPFDDYSEAQNKSDESVKAVSKAKSFKDDLAKTKGSKSLEKISLSDHEDLYFSKEGEFWYVSKEPDGSTTKMQVQVDKVTGELTAVDGGYYAKSEGSLDLHRIPMSDNEDIYINKEGQAWYVSEQPDGSTAKIQLKPD